MAPEGQAARPHDPSPAFTAAVAAVLASYFLLWMLHTVVTGRGLWDDGSYFLLKMAEHRAVVSPELSRWIGNLLIEWPALLALSAGIRSLPLLGAIFTFGMFYLAPLTLALCWLLLPAHRKDLFVFPLLSLLLGWMAASFFAIGKTQVVAVWFWPTLFATLHLPLSNARQRAGLLLLAAPTLLMHEAMSYLGLILAGAAAWRLRGTERGPARIVLGLAAAWFILGVGIALWYVAFPVIPTNRGYFVRGVYKLHFLGLGGMRLNWPAVTALVGAGLLGWSWLRPQAMAKRVGLWLPPVALLFGVAALAPILFAERFAPVTQNHARGWAVLVPAALALLMLAREAGWVRSFPLAAPLSRSIIAGIALAQITWQVCATAQWAGYVEVFRGELAGRSGLVRYEDTLLARPRIGVQALSPVVTGWTNVPMSIVLAPEGRVAAIIDAPEDIDWRPVDPRDPRQLPRVEGIDYDAYLQALR